MALKKGVALFFLIVLGSVGVWFAYSSILQQSTCDSRVSSWIDNCEDGILNSNYYDWYTPRGVQSISEHDGYIDIRSGVGGDAASLYFDKTNYPLCGDYDISFKWRKEYATGHHRCLFMHFLKNSKIPRYETPDASNTYPALWCPFSNPNVNPPLRLRTGDGASYITIVKEVTWGWHTLRIKRSGLTITIWHDGSQVWSGSFSESAGAHENMQFGYHQAAYRHIFLDDINYNSL